MNEVINAFPAEEHKAMPTSELKEEGIKELPDTNF